MYFIFPEPHIYKYKENIFIQIKRVDSVSRKDFIFIIVNTYLFNTIHLIPYCWQILHRIPNRLSVRVSLNHSSDRSTIDHDSNHRVQTPSHLDQDAKNEQQQNLNTILWRTKLETPLPLDIIQKIWSCSIDHKLSR